VSDWTFVGRLLERAEPTSHSGEKHNAMTKEKWLKLGLVALALVGVVAGISWLLTNRPVQVEVARTETNVPVRVFGLGTVEARILSKVGFEVGATLAVLKADHGDRVQQGQVLARLSLGEQEAKVAKARAALEIAQVSIARAKANLEKANAVLAQKELANTRKQSLAGRDIVSQQSAEEALRDVAVARADVSVAESELESAKVQVVDAQAQLRFEETMLEHRTLTAPYDAIVIERHKEAGSVIKAGDPIFTLVAVGTYWGLAHVDEARAGFIQEGQKVDARKRSSPQEAFTGRVARIGLESDRVTEERKIFVKGDTPPPHIFLGEQVEFWITVATLDRAMLVPEAAVHGYDGRQGTAWVVEDGRLKRRRVGFRHRTEDGKLEIVSKIPNGMRVVTRIASAFREGRRATIIETASK
jgi:HlyD family secretion protein